MNKQSTHYEIDESFNELEHVTYGPDKYVVGALRRLVQSNGILNSSIKELRSTATTFNVKAERQTNELISLTKAIIGLTILLLIGLIIQIILALKG